MRVRSPAEAVFAIADSIRGLHDIIKDHVNDKDALEEADKYAEVAREAIQYLMGLLDFKQYSRSGSGYYRGGGRSWRSGGWQRRF